MFRAVWSPQLKGLRTLIFIIVLLYLNIFLIYYISKALSIAVFYALAFIILDLCPLIKMNQDCRDLS